jgi:type I restriction enzyme M protein
MSTDQKQQLQQQLLKIANDLRGKMNADEFRDYILGFIFYKYLSRKIDIYANKILKPDGLTYAEVDSHPQKDEYLDAIKEETLEQLGYFLAPGELFSELARRGNTDGKTSFILGDLAKVLNNIEQSTMGSESEEDFGNLFEQLDLTASRLGKTEEQKNELIVKVLTHLEAIDFEIENTDSDVLGDAYEYLIGKFASGAGKSAGEFYTPQQVSSILAQLVTVGKDKIKSVYDPTCGSGSLLLRVAKELKSHTGLQFFGQESNPTTYNLCRMNMLMHGVHYRNFDIHQEDTLLKPNPKFLDQRFEAIVANPPFSAIWKPDSIINDDRFAAYGKMAPKSKADFAFVQHMAYQLADNGTMATVLPHGVLFRGASEGHIRKYLINDLNYLDAVIGLPANIFYGTSIPTCILVLRKNRNANDPILFIDSSQQFEKVKTQNVLNPEHIAKLVDTYTDYRTNKKDSPLERGQGGIDKYAYIATKAEIIENDYNLNIPRYVDTFEEEEPIDIGAVANDLAGLNKNMSVTDKTIASFCTELGIKSPF